MLGTAIGKLFRLLRRVHLLVWILLWTIIGILLGLFAEDFSVNYMGLISTHVFLPMVKSIIVPLVFSTLIVGIAGHGSDLAKLGRLAAKSMAYFFSLTIVAVFIGLAWANLLRPGDGIYLPVLDADTENDLKSKKTEITFKSELEHIIPTSFFQAAAKNETLQVVFCACFFSMGILLTPHKEARRVMLEFCESLSHIMFKVTELVMAVVPIAIAGAVSETIAKNGIGVLVNLGKLMACVYVGLLSFILLLCVVALVCRVPLVRFIKTIWEPITIAFATASSDAALPLAMEKLVEFGVPDSVVAFTIPVGYTFNLDGTTLYLGCAAIFACQAGGVEKTIGEQIVMVLLLMLMGKGVAGVPRASLVILATASDQFGLPPSAVPVILTVDNFMDMGRTAVNLIGNCLASVIIAKWEGEFPAVKDHATPNDIEASVETVDVDKKDHKLQ